MSVTVLPTNHRNVSGGDWFYRQLCDWLHDSEWHYRTLVAICIQVLKPIPQDIDSVINALLLAHPEKPDKPILFSYLTQNDLIKAWFSYRESMPTIQTINLSTDTNKKLISKALPIFDNPKQLADWLNISVEQLNWLADITRYDSLTPQHLMHYHYHVLTKRSGNMRLIESPKVILKGIQRKILDELVHFMPVHHAAHGFQKNKNCISHASCHTKKHYLFLFDLSNCFQSIEWKKVYRLFINLGYKHDVVIYLCGLCTHRIYLNHPIVKNLIANEKGFADKIKQRHLPQGAPSSPALANAALFKLDSRLQGLANKLNLEYSRYADDMAFSGNSHRDWRFLESLVGAICLEEGFALNHHKSRLLKPHQQQKITGVVINSKINIDRRYYDELKAILNNCAKWGIDSQNREKRSDFKAYLYGRIQYVKQLNEIKGKKLEAIYTRL